MADEDVKPETTAERSARLKAEAILKAMANEAPSDPNPVFLPGTDPDPIIPPSPPEESFNVAEAIKAAGVNSKGLEAALDLLLKQKAEKAKAAFDPKEPDYSKLTEKDYYNPEFYIPVVTHDIPEYMDVKLKDTSYVAVWANLDQRRIGQLLAEGYEAVRKEHIDPHFHLPLKFNSEGLYIYQDVVCLRVHKRIKIAKLRKIADISAQQLKKAGTDAKIKGKLIDAVLGDPYLENAFINHGLGFYEPTPQ